MNAIKPEMESLKTKLKAMWMSGDYGQVAKHIETGAEEFIDRLALKSSDRLLDVACGSGNLAIPAARAGAIVTGVDIATNLLEQARARAASEGLTIQFDEGDAEELPYSDETFDVVVSMFGVMFAPRPELVAAELVRVCRPGGRIALANWTPDGFIGQMFKIHAKYVPSPPNMPSPLKWGDRETARNRLGDRVANLQLTQQICPFKYNFSPAEVVESFRTYYGPTQRAFDALDKSDRACLRMDLERLWFDRNQATDNTTYVQGEYLEVIATKN